MKSVKYTGLFKSAEGYQYSLHVTCNGFLQAFFLLTARAIDSGKHYQLYTIIDERSNLRHIGDILKCSSLITE